MKDLFSKQSNEYAKFRPSYPKAMVETLIDLCSERELVWDAGTGNGQLAAMLSDHFIHVHATDISAKQLSNAVQRANVTYAISDSTHIALHDTSVNLITVAQAVHWFNTTKFYAEVNRVLKPDGIIALLGYGVMRSDPATDEIIQHFYHQVTGPYWDPERKLIDEHYATLPFPFKEIAFPKFNMNYKWNVDQLIGYFSTWSALQHLIEKTGVDPLPELKRRFESTGNTTFQIEFPLFFRIGKRE